MESVGKPRCILGNPDGRKEKGVRCKRVVIGGDAVEEGVCAGGLGVVPGADVAVSAGP